ncbi:electron transport complex subunit RsxC [Sulfurivermis fontis]|uniref:electron transport complex subunit RsxC n=1 Tax=Sulfurivermis fontis TaxID=1972068 RepID=UPI000FDC81BB|nr:electron transport complex subunit RsxC [Sulfurivermis fontis]
MSTLTNSAAPARLWKFHGGLHLPDHKALSCEQAIAPAALPKRLVLPLQQHIGAPAKPIVEVGERVLKGQIIGQPDGFVSAALHAPTSGTVVAIEERPVPHPSGLSAPCIVIDSDGEDRWVERQPHSHWAGLDPSELRNIIREAGIVGLGGAGFPSFIKLNPGARTEVDTLILNAAECEPYITCDDRLMRERADEVIAGARIMRHALHARRVVIGIEDNKPQAHAALGAALARIDRSDIELVQVPTRYPTGGEKQLIKVLTGKEVPSQGLPIDISVVCHNVATAAAVHRAVELGEPLITRIVTVTGRGVAQPRNLEVLIGTPVDDLLQQCGGTTPTLSRLVLGGPLMGITLQHHGLPVTKTGNCILALTPGEFGQHGPVRNCIRCGECARVCPANLLPQQLYWHARAKDFDKVQDYNLFDCIECGCCAYVCPTNLPLVQYYRYAKTTIWSQARDKKKAELARERHDFRLERQEREKAERAAKLAKKKAALEESPATDSEEAKKAAIKAAMERAKAKHEAAGVEPKNTDNLTPEQQRQIDEVEARRAAAEKEE